MIALIVSIGGILIGIINHKRLRSKCCKKTLEVSLDIENTTPTRIQPLQNKNSSPTIENATRAQEGSPRAYGEG